MSTGTASDFWKTVVGVSDPHEATPAATSAPIQLSATDSHNTAFNATQVVSILNPELATEDPKLAQEITDELQRCMQRKRKHRRNVSSIHRPANALPLLGIFPAPDTPTTPTASSGTADSSAFPDAHTIILSVGTHMHRPWTYVWPMTAVNAKGVFGQMQDAARAQGGKQVGVRIEVLLHPPQTAMSSDTSSLDTVSLTMDDATRNELFADLDEMHEKYKESVDRGEGARGIWG